MTQEYISIKFFPLMQNLLFKWIGTFLHCHVVMNPRVVHYQKNLFPLTFKNQICFSYFVLKQINERKKKHT